MFRRAGENVSSFSIADLDLLSDPGVSGWADDQDMQR